MKITHHPFQKLALVFKHPGRFFFKKKHPYPTPTPKSPLKASKKPYKASCLSLVRSNAVVSPVKNTAFSAFSAFLNAAHNFTKQNATFPQKAENTAFSAKAIFSAYTAFSANTFFSAFAVNAAFAIFAEKAAFAVFSAYTAFSAKAAFIAFSAFLTHINIKT